MPYLPPGNRQVLDEGLPPLTAGELNYCITKLIDAYLARAVNYSRINEVVGVLECAKLELYRRLAAPYEDIKIRRNGDVFSRQVVIDAHDGETVPYFGRP